MHTWYLSVDMQLFLVAPFIIYLIYRFKMKMIIMSILLVIGCIGCTLAVHLQYELKSLYEKKLSIFFKLNLSMLF